MTRRKSGVSRDVVVAWVSPGTVSAFFLSSVVDLFCNVQFAERLAGYDEFMSGPMIALARNDIAARFMATGARWLLTLDSDMLFSSDEIVRLLAHAEDGDHPILAASAPAYVPVSGEGHVEAARLSGGQVWPLSHEQMAGLDAGADDVVPMDCVGAGVCLVRRDVFERMAGKYDPAVPFYATDVCYGRMLGEDWTFCLRARELGIPVALDLSVRVGHVKHIPVTLPARPAAVAPEQVAAPSPSGSRPRKNCSTR